jgi:hypothetical protein
MPDADGLAQSAPTLSYDAASDVVTIDGFKFSRAFFSQITASPCGVRYRIISRNDGVITVGVERDPLEAAASNMLAALRRARGAMESRPEPSAGRVSDELQRMWRADLAAVDAAIAKAEGR